MIRICLYTLLLVFSLFYCGSSIASAYDVAPDFELETLDGKTVKLSELKGKVVYIDFWATWCAPCRRSFPWMERMYQKYRDHGFEIVAVSIDRKRSVIDRFLKKTPVSFTILRDTKGQTAKSYGVYGMPSSYIVGPEGFIRHEHMGFRPGDEAKLENEFEKLLLN